jgi:pimeloyl-ACP methyl ester carboxylesterase
MLPQNIFWTWILSAVNGAILIAACFFLWEWADGMDPPAPAEPVAQRDTPLKRADGNTAATPGAANPEQVTIRRDRRQSDRWGGWPFLVAGIALAALGLCGGWPLILAGRLGAGGPRHPQPDRVLALERPDGARLHIEFHGEANRANGPTFVLTHGWTLERSAWSYVTRELSARFRVVVWELRGHTRSTSPTNGDFAIETMARDLEAVMQAAGEGPILLVGHSIGGMINQTFSRLFPQHLGKRVVGIALVHTTYTNPLRTSLFAPLWTLIEKPIIVPMNYLAIGLAPLVWLSNMQSYLNGSLHIMTRIATFSGRQTWGQLDYAAWLAAIVWPGVMARGNLAMLAFDEQRQLPQVTIPLLVVAGRHDRMTRPEASDHIAALAPNAREMPIESGHLGVWEQSGEMAALLTEFAFQAGDRQPRDATSMDASSRQSESLPK